MEKKDKIKLKINEFTDKAIDKAAEEGSLEYFEMEIKHHKGDLQLNNITKTREKVY